MSLIPSWKRSANITIFQRSVCEIRGPCRLSRHIYRLARDEVRANRVELWSFGSAVLDCAKL